MVCFLFVSVFFFFFLFSKLLQDGKEEIALVACYPAISGMESWSGMS